MPGFDSLMNELEHGGYLIMKFSPASEEGEILLNFDRPFSLDKAETTKAQLERSNPDCQFSIETVVNLRPIL